MLWPDDCKQLAKALKNRICLPHQAVGVRLASPEEAAQAPSWLEDFRKPGKGLPEKMLICQAMAMVRLYGWQVVVTPDSMECPTGLATMGWVAMSPDYQGGVVPLTPYNQTVEARRRRMEQVPALERASVALVAAAPLATCPFEPHVVMIYCSPGQAMRLVQSALFHKGGAIHASSTGAQGCSQYLTKVIQEDTPRFVLPGNGDRIFGHVEDSQMAFSLPGRLAGRLAEGVEKSHKGGQVYPVPGYVRGQMEVPHAYVDASAHLRAYTRGRNE